MSTGAWVLVVAVVGALAFGLFRALTDGRFRGTHQVQGAEEQSEDSSSEPVAVSLLAETEWADQLGQRSTTSISYAASGSCGRRPR